MQFKRKSFMSLVAVAIAVGSVATSSANEKSDIVDTAVAAGSFKTLAAALGAADLVDALKSDGPFTVFAPTDEAFAKLPEGTVATLLKPENKDQLTAILTYHVVAGRVPAKQVASLTAAPTLNGQRVDVSVSGGTVKIDNATVVKTDIECSNGIIHVIDNVILPSSDNIPTTASKAGQFSTLLAAAQAAGLVEALSGKGPLTVFAPTDEAFAKLPKGTVETLLKPENKGKLAAVLKYHVVPGRVYSDDAVKAKSAKTLQGDAIHVSVRGGKAKINDSNLVATDIDASNGVIHVIDAVLLPPEKSKKIGAVEAQKMIEDAVARGAKLYNSGHHQACAQLYETTARRMVDLGSDEMPPLLMSNLKKVLVKIEHCDCPSERSWTLRRGLDSAYFAMRKASHH